MLVIQIIVILLTGCLLGTLLLTIKTDLHPQYRGFFYRWLYFLGRYGLPALSFPVLMLIIPYFMGFI